MKNRSIALLIAVATMAAGAYSYNTKQGASHATPRARMNSISASGAPTTRVRAIAVVPSSPMPAVADGSSAPACRLISALPYTISESGQYCMQASLASASFYGIRIQASNVDLDCQGHGVSMTAARTPGSDGIFAVSPANSVSIRNCVVNGFDRGIAGFGGTSNLRIFNNEVREGISDGIVAWGDGAHIRGNRVLNMHHTDGFQQSYGISLLPKTPEVPAIGQIVENNVVANAYGGSQIVGISVGGSTAPVITGNTVMELRPVDGGNAIAIWLTDWAQGARTTGARLTANQLTSRGGAYNDVAMQTVDSIASCDRNMTIGVSASNLMYCASGSGNVVVP